MATERKCGPYINSDQFREKFPYVRNILWLILFYLGLPVLAAFCLIYAVWNPDQEVWYGAMLNEHDCIESEGVFKSYDEALEVGKSNDSTITNVH